MKPAEVELISSVGPGGGRFGKGGGEEGVGREADDGGGGGGGWFRSVADVVCVL